MSKKFWVSYTRFDFIKNTLGINSKEAVANMTRLLKKHDSICSALQSVPSQYH